MITICETSNNLLTALDPNDSVGEYDSIEEELDKKVIRNYMPMYTGDGIEKFVSWYLAYYQAG